MITDEVSGDAKLIGTSVLATVVFGVLVGGDNEPEAIVGFAVGISGVVQRQKVALRVDDARFGASAPAAEVSLVIAVRMSAVVDVEVIIAVECQLLEPQHELLQNGVRLERDRAVEVVLRLGADDGAIDLLVQRVDALAETQRRDVIKSISIRGHSMIGDDESEERE